MEMLHLGPDSASPPSSNAHLRTAASPSPADEECQVAYVQLPAGPDITSHGPASSLSPAASSGTSPPPPHDPPSSDIALLSASANSSPLLPAVAQPSAVQLPPQCRICLEEDVASSLIVPCPCRDSARYTHRRCLDTWRAVHIHDAAFHSCQSCLFRYHLIPAQQPAADIDRRQRRDRFVLVRDLLTIFCILQAWLVALATGVFLMDSEMGGRLEKVFPHGTPGFAVGYVFAVVFTLAMWGVLGEVAAVLGWDGSRRRRLEEDELGCCNVAGCECGEMGGDVASTVIFSLLMAVLVAVVAAVGIVYGLWYATAVSGRMLRQHVLHAWYMAETLRLPVKDWSGQEEELLRVSQREDKPTPAAVVEPPTELHTPLL